MEGHKCVGRGWSLHAKKETEGAAACVCVCVLLLIQAMTCKCPQREEPEAKNGARCESLECTVWRPLHWWNVEMRGMTGARGQWLNESSALQHLSGHRQTVFACIQIYRGVLTLPIVIVTYLFGKLCRCGCPASGQTSLFEVKQVNKYILKKCLANTKKATGTETKDYLPV